MIKTLKRQFIVTAMVAVTVLLAVLLGGVNLVNAWSSSQEAQRLLEDLVRMEIQGRRELPAGEEGQEPPDFPEEGQEPPEFPEEAFPPQGERERRGFLTGPLTENDRLSALYFSAAVQDGTVTRVDVTRLSTLTQEEARRLAQEVLDSGAESGSLESYRYLSGKGRGGETIYVFLENSARSGAVLRVAALSALAGAISWLLMLGLVVLLSKRAIAPIAENMERQRRFVTDAGHELKTPLSIIQANTEAMELISGETKWSRNIKTQVTRLTELTRDLLTLARAEEVPAQGSLAPVEFSALVEKSVQMFRIPMERKELRLEQELTQGLRVQGNESQLGNLCSILLDNAVKYASPGSALRLSLRAGEKTCTLRLENDCETLPDCPPERLFDRFYRADAARTQSSGGFGIGLSAAQIITLQHRGRLEAEYPSDHSVAFSVTLPLLPPN